MALTASQIKYVREILAKKKRILVTSFRSAEPPDIVAARHAMREALEVINKWEKGKWEVEKKISDQVDEKINELEMRLVLAGEDHVVQTILSELDSWTPTLPTEQAS